MYKAHSLGRFFVVLASQACGSPLVDSCFTSEKEHPFRTGNGILIRLPFMGNRITTGLVLGKWRAKQMVMTIKHKQRIKEAVFRVLRRPNSSKKEKTKQGSALTQKNKIPLRR